MSYFLKTAILFPFIFFLQLGQCEWKEVSQSDKGTYYVDFGSVRLIDDGIRSVWILINYNIVKEKVKSRQLKLEMDCTAGEMRIKSKYSFTGFFSGGIPIKDYYKTEEWRSIETDENLGIVHKQFCKN